MSDKKPDDELIGQTIAGRYRIISRLGAGGMGIAYRAWDEEEEVPVVIKMPQERALIEPAMIERFRREARFLRGLNHPHIVPILEVGEHGRRPFVAMRFLPGGSLSNRRLRDDDGKPRSNPPGMLHLWLPAIAEALDFVHSHGVVHRDMKPGNIFFDARWGAFLGDFGIAKIVEESESFDRENTLTATNMGMGTEEYMSPEQFTPKGNIDGRTDQYSLAVSVYELIAGVRPFRGETAHLIVEILTFPIPPLESRTDRLPASLVNAVHRGLAKNPHERFPNCREFANHVLRDVPPLADEPDVTRLLCPKCSAILKLPITAAGEKGKCPKCQTAMRVADDLGALWMLDEARRQRRLVASLPAAEAVKDDSEPGPSDTRMATEEDVKAFEPVSSRTPGEPHTFGRAERNAAPRSFVIGIVAAVIGLLGFILLNPINFLHPTLSPIGRLLRSGTFSYAEPVGWTLAAVSLAVSFISIAWLIVQSRRAGEQPPKRPGVGKDIAEADTPASAPAFTRFVERMPQLCGITLVFGAILSGLTLLPSDDRVRGDRPYVITMAWADDDGAEFCELEEEKIEEDVEPIEAIGTLSLRVPLSPDFVAETFWVEIEHPFSSPPAKSMELDIDFFGGIFARGFNFAGDGLSEQVPGGYTWRAQAAKLAASGGGGGDTEEAVDRALEWFAQHQMPDGGWSFDLTACPSCMGKCSHSETSRKDDRGGATAMALLPFLGRGYTHQEGPYKKQVEGGIGYLVGLAMKGNGKAYGAGGNMYSQGLAGIALSECYAMSQDNRLAAPTQAVLNYIMQSQDPVGGGWRYSPRQPGDTSAVGWQIMALKSGNMARLQVNPLTVKKAVEFLDFVQSDDGAAYGYLDKSNPSPTRSAVGLLCRMYLGWKKDRPGMQEGAKRIAKQGPNNDLYYNYYATQIMHHMEGEMWLSWNNKMKAMLLKSQSNKDHEAGSWHEGVNGGHGAEAAGRLYCTSLATMILEVYYRHVRLYLKDDLRMKSEFRE